MGKVREPEDEIEGGRRPGEKRRDVLRSIIRAGQVAGALTAIGGLIGDFLRPLAAINLLVFAGASVAAIVLLVLCVKRVRFLNYGLGLACFFAICLALGFGAWWQLAESRGGGGRGFLAEHVPIVGELQAAVIADRRVEGRRLIDGPAIAPPAPVAPAGGLEGALRGYPAKVIKAEVVGEPKVKKKSGAEVELGYTLRVAVDLASYQSFADGLVAELGKVATAHGETLAKGVPYERNASLDPYMVLTSLAGPDYASSNARDFHIDRMLQMREEAADRGFDHDWWRSKLDKDDQMAVVVNTARSGLDDRTTWAWFHVPKVEAARRGVVVDITFLDAKGGELSRDRFSFRDGSVPGLTARKRPFSDDNWQVEERIISPYCLFENRSYWRTTDFPMAIRLTPDETRRLATIRCSVTSSD